MGSIKYEKPLILVASTPATGHMFPMRVISRGLLDLGYDVTFIGPTSRRAWLEECGVTFVPLPASADFTEADADRLWPERKDVAPGVDLLLYDMSVFFIGMIPAQFLSIQATLKNMRERHPGRKILLLGEGMHCGWHPLKLNAPGEKPDGIIGVGVVPVLLTSKDTAPFGQGLPPDRSPEGQERNMAMNAHLNNVIFSGLTKEYQKALESCGAEGNPETFSDYAYTGSDRFLQTTVPELEYPRSDAPKHFKFIGTLPNAPRLGWPDAPSWWSDIVTNESKKKIIFVCQGTVAQNFDDLIIPTSRVMAGREDLLVVVALGRRGATLPATTLIPANTRVAGFIPFQEILYYADVFVTNGGYGGFQQSIAHGVPLVVAGVTEDKVEVAARAEWSGCAVNLKTSTPTDEALRAGIDEILSNEKYARMAKKLEAKIKTMNPIGTLVSEIEAVIAGVEVK